MYLRVSRCSIVTCVICKSATAGAPTMGSIVRGYWDGPTTKFSRIFQSIGDKRTGVLWQEKRCEPMRSVGIVRAAPPGSVGKFCLGGIRSESLGEFLFSRKRLLVVNR